MPLYRFTAVVDTEVAETETAKSFPSLGAARDVARAALGRIAAERLSRRDIEMISIEIFDEAEVPLTELRLEFREIAK